MKVEFINKKIVVYLYNQKLNLDDSKELSKNIKKIILSIINQYNYQFSGLFKVIIYENIKYGYVLEISLIKEYDYSDYIDMKIEIKKHSPMYLVFDNYNYIEGIKKFIFKNNLYYVDIKNISNIQEKMEYGYLVYNLNI